ncbi:hypothetical protein BUALT_Bualt03G0206700 [Buddleja alternifolia]|uniref:Uncharacterized protein n=1 Tax=Buddleja alternifolia TaxID=168488 RepID=A0AAV6Y206_9LAMI|nr:hypothetical protein BUALT_Bualt03G0206700 [Buddleja alternifolia]
MAEALRSVEMRREIDALKDQFSSNLEHNQKMFEDIHNMIVVMVMQQHQSHSPRSMEHEGTSAGRGNWGQGYQAEQFFEMDDTLLEAWVRLAAVHFKGKALQ